MYFLSLEFQGILDFAEELELAGEGNHRAVVRGELGARGAQDFAESGSLAAGGAEAVSELAVGGDAADEAEGCGLKFLEVLGEGGEQCRDRCVEEGAREVGAILGGVEEGRIFLEEVGNLGFDARKTEIAAVGRVEKVEGEVLAGLAVFGEFGESAAAGVGSAEEACDFVEGFAGCVVAGRGDELGLEFAGIFGPEKNLGVAAGDGQNEGGQRDLVETAFEEDGENVGLDVVDGEDGAIKNLGEGRGGAAADDEGSGQAGRVGDGDRGNLGENLARGLADEFDEGVEVGAGGELGHDATELGVDGVLGNCVEGVDLENSVAELDEGERGIVAAGFDPEDLRGVGHRGWRMKNRRGSSGEILGKLPEILRGKIGLISGAESGEKCCVGGG